jgi:hypothetical protein
MLIRYVEWQEKQKGVVAVFLYLVPLERSIVIQP